MDIDQLPDVALLRVMEFLPFIEQVRVGLVSQRFREFSQIVVSRTKSLNFGDKKLFERGIEPDQAITLLELCSRNLEAIEFGSGDLASQIFSTGFRLEHCSKLNLNLGESDLEADELSQIISDHPDVLESLQSYSHPIAQLNLGESICEKLHTLNFGVLENGAFESLTGRCPNLITFEFVTYHVDTRTFDRFLSTVPRVQSFNLASYSDGLEMGNCANFFRLPLTRLELEYTTRSSISYINDVFIRKVVQCFPDLEELALYLDHVSEAGALMLRRLARLRELTVRTFVHENLHVRIVNINLESFDMRCHKVSAEALGDILISCPRLRRIVIRDIADVLTEERGIEMVSNLEDLEIHAREITIVFSVSHLANAYQMYTSIWKSDSVEQALVEFQERKKFEIRIEHIDAD